MHKDKMPENLKDKVVAITGASSGIGKATAEKLAAAGAKLVLGARDEEKLKAFAESVTQNGGNVSYLTMDVRKRDDLNSMVDLACEKYGKLDVLFSNAGVMPIGPLDELKVDDWETMVDINLKGVLFGIAAALPLFRKQGFGHFINTASTAAYKTVANQSVYSATKYAVRALSEGLRQEAGEKIKVTIISPGFVDTNFTDGINNAELKAQLSASREKLAMSPDAVAAAVVFAIEQPEGVSVNEIVMRSTLQK